MAWIRTVPEAEASSELRALYARAADPKSGRVDNILAVHSLDPAGMAAHLGLYQAAMRGSRGLPRVERELIALVVSLANGCHY